MNFLVLFPILTTLSTVYLITCCYIQGALKGHYNPIFPYVSDTGNFIPESGSFSMAIITAGVSFLMGAMIRYVQLTSIINDSSHFGPIMAQYYELNDSKVECEAKLVTYQNRFNCLNKWSFIGSIAISCSLMLVSAFRMVESYIFHNLSASGVFVFIPAVMAVNVHFSRVFSAQVNSRALYHFRLVICCMVWVFAATFLTTNGAFYQVAPAEHINPRLRLQLTKTDRGYWLHLVATIVEWWFMLLTAIYIYTFAIDFSRFKLRALQVEYTFV